MMKEKYWIYTMQFFSKYWGCHQLPSRSFFIGKYQFPLCARCTGIMFGSFLSLLLLSCDIEVMDRFSVLQICILITPMIIDGCVQMFTTYESNNTKRLLTGGIFGVGIWFLIFDLIAYVCKYGG